MQRTYRRYVGSFLLGAALIAPAGSGPAYISRMTGIKTTGGGRTNTTSATTTATTRTTTTGMTARRALTGTGGRKGTRIVSSPS